jgi:acyl-CoA thioester hydrolase
MGRPSPELLDPSAYPFVNEITTRFADVDPNQHINNVAIAAAFEDSRVRLDMRGDLRDRERYHGVRVVVAAAYIDYLAEAHYPAPLRIHGGVIAIGRSSWTVGQLAMQEGQPRAFCRATLVSTDGSKAQPIPDTLRHWLEQSQVKLAAEG